MGDRLLTHLITKTFRSGTIGMARELKRQKGELGYGYSETYKGFDLIKIVKLDCIFDHLKSLLKLNI